LWQRMKKLEEAKGTFPEFLSTHPSNANRITRIQQWLPEAGAIQDETDCATGASYVGDFVKMLGLDFVRDDPREHR